MARDDDIVRGPPVHLLSNRLPFEHPQYIGPGPHNLPAPIARPGQRGFIPVAGLPPGMAPPDTPPMPFDDKYRYATLSGESIVAVGVASVQALQEPAVRRNLLGFRNSSTGGQNIFIAFGANATTNSFLLLTPNQMVLFDTVVPQDEVYCVASAAGGQLTVAVSNYVPGL